MVRFPKKYQLKNGTQVIARTIIEDYWTKERSIVFQKVADDKFYSLTLNQFADILTKEAVNENVSLYRELFRGRTDVYANRYYNKKQQKEVYSPAYKWQWQPEKGRSEIQTDKDGNRIYKKLTDDAISAHLNGEKFLGIYPILENDACYFCALDFDKTEWQEAAVAVQKISEQYGLRATIEKSQSGNGAHVWYFFQEPITCKLARSLGTLLLTKTMSLNAELSFSCFDRMFPSQDTLPKKGLGNLIALPLQGNRVLEKKSLFLDERLRPHENQWGFLTTIPRYSKKTIETIVTELGEQNELYYFTQEASKQVDLLKEDESSIKEPLVVIKSNYLEIEEKQLSKQSLLQLKGLASFRNPEFYQRQAMRQSTYNYPRIISLFEESADRLYLPRGLENKLFQKVDHLKIIDKTLSGHTLKVAFQGKLRPDQKSANSATKQVNMGIISADTGFGKTVLACKMISDRKVNTLILVHNKNLADQWCRQLKKFLSIQDEPLIEYTKKGKKKKKEKIGQMYGSKFKRSNLVDVATFQTLANKKNLQEVLDQYGMVIVDECHHIAAPTFERVVKSCKVKYVYGLSATPKRKDGHEPISLMRCGEVIWREEKNKNKALVKQILIPRFLNTGENFREAIKNNEIYENYQLIVEDEKRNQLILEDIIHNLNEKRHLLVLSERVHHLADLASQLRSLPKVPLIYELNGKMKDKQKTEVIDKLNREKDAYVLLSTGSYVGEGFDLSTLDTICLTMPISWGGRLQQYLGRLQRNLVHKKELRVYDYIDFAIPMFSNMYQKRLITYRKLGCKIILDEMSQSNNSEIYSSDDYYDIFNKDIYNAQQSVQLSIARLNKKIVAGISKIASTAASIEIWTQKPEKLSSASRKKQNDCVNQLIKKKVKIHLIDWVTNICVIDNRITWYGSISYFGYPKEGTSALRLIFPSIAKQFTEMLHDLS